ncbi:MAG: 50S ribosomal protein L10 [Clostridiales bacterium]|nr:50S ribosomal protein L10 [Clostridiales bacterium]
MNEETNKKPQMLEKEAEVARLTEMLGSHEAAMLINYKGISVKDDTELRVRMRSSGVKYLVAKNTLIKRACHDVGINSMDEFLQGTTAVAFARDPVALAKVVSQFMKEFRKLEVKAGLLEGKAISAKHVDALAKLPSKEILLSQVLAGLQTPMSQFAGVASAMLRQLVTVVDKVREQKAAG